MIRNKLLYADFPNIASFMISGSTLLVVSEASTFDPNTWKLAAIDLQILFKNIM